MIKKFQIKKLEFECNQYNIHKAAGTKKVLNQRKSYKRVGFGANKIITPAVYYEYKFFTLFKRKLITLTNLNIFVGDNGSGKTTLIKEITRGRDKVINLGNLSKASIQNEIRKAADENSFNGSNDCIRNIVDLWNSSTSSNGEVILSTLNYLEKLIDIKDFIFCFDEPETSISLRNQIRLRNIIKKLSENNQIFLSTHSPIFMELSSKIFDVETLKWVDQKEYLNNLLK